MLFPLIYCFQISLQSMKRQFNLILLLVTLACLITGADSARPKQKGLVPGYAGALKSNSIEEIISYSDLNRDGRIDIITKSANLQMGQQQLNFYIWNAKLKEFQLWGSMPTNYINLQTVLVSSFKVLSDFHMVLFFNPADASPYIQMIPFFCSNYQCQFGNQFVVPEIKSGIDASPPSLIGIKGKIGLLYHAKGIANVLLFELNETLNFSTTPLSELVENGSSITNILHSYNGDYDGDCLTDMIILKADSSNPDNSILQFIRGSENNQYQLVQSKTIMWPVQHFTLQDINFDGKNDLILLLKSSKLQIHYHRYGTDTKLCNGIPINELPYDFQTSEQQARLIQRVQFTNALYPKSLLLFGDYNNDGYGDISITFMDKDNVFPQSALLENQPCLGAACGTYNPRLIQQSSTLNLRSFSIKPILGNNQISSKLSFIDLFDDGNLDFMFHLQVADPTGIKYTTIQTVYNNMDYDAFFLTITIYSSLNDGDIFAHTEYIGGVASFYVTLLSGVLQPRTGNQLSQTGNALQLPYIHQGLGRTNNYLEDLTITVPRNPYSQFKWSPIIPNSDINIAPPPQNQPDSPWVLQVMIEPTQKMAFVLLLVIVSLGILGVVILRLSRKQKEQDKQTQQSFYTLLR